MKSPQQDEYDLSWVVAALQKHWRLIAATAILGAVVALTYTIMVKPVWRARITMMLVLGGDGGGQADPTLALLGTLSPSAPDPLQVYEGVIRSRPTLERLREKFGIPVRSLEDALGVERRSKAAQLSIKWEDEDKERAKAIVTEAADALLEMQDEMGFTVAAKRANYLEQVIEARRRDLQRAEMDLANYQGKMNAPSNPADPTSVEAYLSRKKDLELEIAALEGRIGKTREQAAQKASSPELPASVPNTEEFRKKLVQLEYDLNVALIDKGPLAPDVRRLQREIDVTRDALRTQTNAYLSSIQKSINAEVSALENELHVKQLQLESVSQLASRAPTEAVALGRLTREVQTLDRLLADLRMQYESAKVASEVGAITLNVLEPAYVEDVPTNKRLAFYPAVGLLMGLGMGCVFAAAVYRRNMKRQTA